MNYLSEEIEKNESGTDKDQQEENTNKPDADPLQEQIAIEPVIPEVDPSYEIALEGEEKSQDK
jgi:hypothetical protein